MTPFKIREQFCVAFVLSLFVGGSFAGPPAKKSINGLELGITSAQVQKWAQQAYPNCSLQLNSLRDPKDGENSLLATHYDLRTALCSEAASTTAPKFSDTFTFWLLNKDLKFADRVYSIALHREFLLSAGPMYGGPAYTLRETMDTLINQFGKPTFAGSTDEENAVNKRNLAKLETEKWQIRQTTMWWGQSGFNKSDGMCNSPCNGVRLKARIVTWMTPFDPSGEYVASITLNMTDGAMEAIDEARIDRIKAATKKNDGLKF